MRRCSGQVECRCVQPAVVEMTSCTGLASVEWNVVKFVCLEGELFVNMVCLYEPHDWPSGLLYTTTVVWISWSPPTMLRFCCEEITFKFSKLVSCRLSLCNLVTAQIFQWGLLLLLLLLCFLLLNRVCYSIVTLISCLLHFNQLYSQRVCFRLSKCLVLELRQCRVLSLMTSCSCVLY